MRKIAERLRRRPARIVALSFVLVAVTGALLLSLPIAVEEGRSLSPLDALFTATSAVCVTGLIVADTPTTFSLFGEIVILVLIQIGGLGIMAFSLAAIFLTRRRLSVSQTELLSYMLSEDDRSLLRRQIFRVVLFTLVIEAVGAVILYFPMREAAGDHSAVWLAIFHAVSAFCNAGFSLFSDSLSRFAGSFGVNTTVAVLILAGGVGFATLSILWDDLAAWYRHVRPRGRKGTSPPLFRAQPEWRYVRSEAARIALGGTVILVLSGAVIFYLFERNNTIAFPALETNYLAAFFQSVTLRTAGFNTVDIAALRRGTLLATLPFMFIGAAGGGTAGGIKLGTVAVVWADVRRFFLGQRDAVLMYRRVTRRTISQAYVLIVTGVSVVFVSATVLAVTESAAVEALLFEVVSALGTVGLSAGVTGGLTAVGRIVVIVLMFLGRLGPLTLVLALQPRPEGGEIRFPDGRPPVG